MDVEPLKWPAALQHPTGLQRALMGFPFLGIDLRAYKGFRRQVAARPDEYLQAWSRDDSTARAREAVVDILETEMAWGCRKFIPSDPCDILLFDPSLDMKSATAFMQIEDLLGRAIEEEAFKRMTLGQLVNLVAGVMTKSRGGPSERSSGGATRDTQRLSRSNHE
jgi:hypothetical protein